jgi:cytochrome P450
MSPEDDMRTIVVVVSLMALLSPSFAAQSHPSLEKLCRQLVGKEEPEATDGKSHMGQLNVQRFSDCMMGVPR